MDLPYKFHEEAIAIHREKLMADGVDPSAEEASVVAEHRSMQLGIILGKKLGACGLKLPDLQKAIDMISGKTADDGTMLKEEARIAEAMLQARLEFRKFLGLQQEEENS